LENHAERPILRTDENAALHRADDFLPELDFSGLRFFKPRDAAQ
jgi:hypothetical protein